MSKLLDKVTSGKVPFQAYMIEHGIERIRIQIPLANAQKFETAIREAVESGMNSKDGIIKIMIAHKGKVRSA